MNNLIEQMENYAKLERIPIMTSEGISFVEKYIKENKLKNILEIGSAIGYSAIKMALIDKDIHVTTIERDKERYDLAVQNIKLANLEDRIKIIYGDALETTIDGNFDMIFIDAAKAQYTKFFVKYSPQLVKNGAIITDNLKFHGFVENPELTNNRNTKQLARKIKSFIEWLKENEEFSTEFLDIGDGVAVSKRK